MANTSAIKDYTTLTLDELEILIEHLSPKVSLYCWGGVGVGKSQRIKQFAESRHIGFLDQRLANLDPVEMRGCMYMSKDGVSQYSFPAILPRTKAMGGTDPDEGILFLDELNLAHPSVQSGAYELILDRRIGEHKLPDGWRVVAAGNREGDRCNVFSMSEALNNRFMHIEVVANFNVWRNWAMGSNVAPEVIAYLSNNHGAQLAPEPKGEDVTMRREFPTPRSWVAVSDSIQSFGGLHLDGPLAKIQLAALSGSVGTGTAAQFLAFCRLRDKLPDMDNFFEGKKVNLSGLPADIQFALYAALCSQMETRVKDDAKFFEKVFKKAGFVDNLKSVFKNCHKEFTELLILHISKRHPQMIAKMAKDKELYKLVSNHFAAMAITKAGM